METRRAKSTNPFDDDFSEGSAEEQFHDAHEEEPDPRRAAPLNFEKPFDEVEDPALKFDHHARKVSNEFFSPLENAMLQLGGTMSESPTTHHIAGIYQGDQTPNLEDDDITETSPLITSDSALAQRRYSSSRSHARARIPTEITTGRGGSRTAKTPRRHSSLQTKQDLVLNELASGENEFTMDYKYILLEDLGTRSSWLILLLPYLAFFLSLLIESWHNFRVDTTEPMTPMTKCAQDIIKEPFFLTSQQPCWSPFSDIVVDQGRYSLSGTYNKTLVAYSGTAFDSGRLPPIPILSTFLNGDAVFMGLNHDIVAMVAQGSAEVGFVLLQQDPHSNSTEEPWSLMYESKVHTLSMSCQNNVNGVSTWDCKTPQIVDVVFSMPDAAIYEGGDIRVGLHFSHKESPEKTLVRGKGNQSDTFETIPSHVFMKNKRDTETMMATTVSNPDVLIERLVRSSSYTFEHMSHASLRVDTSIRLFTFTISFWFFLYWCYKMKLHNALMCCGRMNEATLWWESPWIIFPSRNYIVVLLVSLLLMQEPGLAVMMFYPDLAASSRLHVIADATIGIGVQGALFVYLCLFQGFRYHTASITKKRSEHQRQMLQLRRAVKYVSNKPVSPSEQHISDHTKEFFDQYGDVDGSASTSHLRLQNDPFADGWADFLFLKLCLLFIGFVSVTITAYCRFPPDDSHFEEVSERTIYRFKLAYIVSMIVQFLTLLLWMYLILVAAIVTGRKLRLQPFLGTRPVQLSYRILLAHMSLGFVALTVSFFTNLSHLLDKWTVTGTNEASGYPPQSLDESTSKMEITIKLLSQLAQQFPYSGTAASVGSGKILFATVSILITAFIFLPAHILDEEDDEHYIETWGTTRTTLNDKLHEHRRLRRDKRLVVNLARDSRTWRVFPLPIKRSDTTNMMLQDDVFQLYKDMTIDTNIKAKGVVSVGPYTPVFCLELACWLNEASWQAYFSPAGITETEKGKNAPPMDLESIGLQLEGAVCDEATDTQAYVATNMASQVDGDADSIIVVAFRGSASATNIQTDIKSRLVPLQDQLAGIGSAAFRVYTDRFEVYDDDGWIWKTREPTMREFVQCVTTWTSAKPVCAPSKCSRNEEPSGLAAVSEGARKLLQVTPVARASFPLVHEGFQECYMVIRKQLLEILLPVLQRQLQCSVEEGATGKIPLALPKIYCTGHSLGGALAELLALDLANNCELVVPAKWNSELEEFYDEEAGIFGSGSPLKAPRRSVLNHDELRLQPPICVYTYGQPRLGNRSLSKQYKQVAPHTFRVVNEGDAITSIPNYLCGGNYKHSGLEVLLDEGMTGNILVGPTVVETLFRFHKLRTSMIAHTLERYRDCLECAFAQEELLEYYRGHNLVVNKIRRATKQQDVVEVAEIPEWMTQSRISTSISRK